MNTPLEYAIPPKTDSCFVSFGTYNPICTDAESVYVDKTGVLPSSVQLRMNSNTNKRLDSLKIEQKIIQVQLDKSLGDIRQETNNIINKINGWFGFWIAMGVFLGIGIPLCSQILISRELSEDIKKLKNKLERNDLRAQKLVAQMRFGIDNRIITAQLGQNFARYLWKEILANNERLINDLLDQNLSTDNNREIQGILVQLIELTTELMRRIYNNDNRNLDKYICKLKLIFTKLDNGDIDRKTLQKEVHILFSQLNALM